MKFFSGLFEVLGIVKIHNIDQRLRLVYDFGFKILSGCTKKSQWSRGNL